MEEGYEFFAKRQLVTIFSAPNYCGEFENAGAMMSVDETLMCSFQVCSTDRQQQHNLRGALSGLLLWGTAAAVRAKLPKAYDFSICRQLRSCEAHAMLHRASLLLLKLVNACAAVVQQPGETALQAWLSGHMCCLSFAALAVLCD